MEMEVECLICDGIITLTWDDVGKIVTCEKCGTKHNVYVDEDNDCNYWFELEKE